MATIALALFTKNWAIGAAGLPVVDGQSLDTLGAALMAPTSEWDSTPVGGLRRTVTGMEYTGLGIHLKVSDIAESRSFYEETLGLDPIRAAGTPEFRRSLPESLASNPDDGLPGSPDTWNSVTYRPTPNAELEIGDGHPAVDSDVFERGIDGPKVSAMLRVGSLVPLVRDRGIRPTYPVRVYPWGSVEAVMRDPDGFVLVLIAPASDDELATLGDFIPVEDTR